MKNKSSIIGFIFLIVFVIGTIFSFWPERVLADPPVIEISTCEELQLIGQDGAYPLSGSYVLTDDIDCSMTNPEDESFNAEDGPWADGDGFFPIGYWDAGIQEPFTGNFDGADHTISGLYINRNRDDVGLFGFIDGANIFDLTLHDITVTGGYGVGGLFGDVDGAAHIDNVHVTGNSRVTGDISYDDGGHYVGGLGGSNSSNATTISNSSSAAEVAGTEYVGGFIGSNTGQIEFSYATGDVTAQGETAGGFVGSNDWGAVIENAYARGAVEGSFGTIGGFVGGNAGMVNNAYSTGDVNGIGEDGPYWNVGGFLGVNIGGTGQLNNVYSTGFVTVTDGYDQSEVFYGFNDGFIDESGYWFGAGTQPFFDDTYARLLKNDMKDLEYDVYQDWDFDTDWAIDTTSDHGTYINAGWPYLAALGAEEEEGDFDLFSVSPGTECVASAYWKFDEEREDIAYDYSGNGLHVLLNNLPVHSNISAPVLFSNPFSLDVDNDGGLFMTLTHSKTTTESFTISFWIKPAEQAWYGSILSENGENGLWFTGLDSFLEEYRMSLWFDGVDHPNDTNFILDQWYHVAFVNNAGTGTWYVNGVPDGMVTGVPSTFDFDAIGDGLNGNLDDLRVYDSALAISDVESLADGNEDCVRDSAPTPSPEHHSSRKGGRKIVSTANAGISDLQNQLHSLLELYKQLSGHEYAPVAVTPEVDGRDLQLGLVGDDVRKLQTFLISLGYSIPAGATGFYGNQTVSAVAAYQTRNGISPAAGNFGPKTRAHMEVYGF